MRGDDRNVDATRYRGDQKTYPILAGAHKAERGARYCSAHGVSQYTLIYIAMRLVVNSCVARNADIGGRTTLSPSPEAQKAFVARNGTPSLRCGRPILTARSDVSISETYVQHSGSAEKLQITSIFRDLAILLLRQRLRGEA